MDIENLTTEDLDTFLEHYGVKGQKWGVRRKRPKAEQREIDKRKKIAEKRRRLSDDDVKKYIDRLSNEKKLKELVDQDVSPGKAAAKKIMSDSGQKVARTVVAGTALLLVKVAISKKFDPDKKIDVQDALKYIAPHPKK